MKSYGILCDPLRKIRKIMLKKEKLLPQIGALHVLQNQLFYFYIAVIRGISQNCIHNLHTKVMFV